MPRVGYNKDRHGDRWRLEEAILTATASREYKDRLFSFIFGSPGNEAWTLSLYNAVGGTSYEDPSAVEINTIREALYLGMHNDVSFLIADEVSVYEQQSTYNPNMPLRMMQYAGNLYERYVVGRGLNKYGRRLLPLPAPRLVVFYNGGEDRPDETVLRLSDSFPDGAPYDLEARVRMVNVNEGRSPGLLAACAPLREYAWLVTRLREAAAAGAEVGDAVDRAITAMPTSFEIKGFLEEHRAEVVGMLLTEYDEVQAMELFREEGRDEGRKEGRAEGVLETLAALVRDQVLTVHQAAERARLDEAEFRARAGLT